MNFTVIYKFLIAMRFQLIIYRLLKEKEIKHFLTEGFIKDYSAESNQRNFAIIQPRRFQYSNSITFPPRTRFSDNFNLGQARSGMYNENQFDQILM